MGKKTITIDLDGKILGRAATQIAKLLIGKNQTSYAPNKVPGIIIIVKNAAKIKLSGRKAEQKHHISFSGYPGGLKKIPIKKILHEEPKKILIHAISGMLPKNKLKKEFLKNLRISP